MPQPLTMKELETSLESGEPLKERDLSGIEWQDLEALDLVLEACVAKDLTIANCDLEGLTLRNCELINCTLTSTSLKEARIEKTRLTNKSEHKGTTFKYCNLEKSAWSESDFSFSAFGGCELFAMTMEKCHGRATSFSDSRFSRRLSQTRSMTELEIKDTNLESALFFGMELDGIKIEDSNLRLAVFEEANLASATLLGCNLQEAEFRGANLSGANLGGSKLTGLDLRTLGAYDDLMISQSQCADLVAEMGVLII